MNHHYHTLINGMTGIFASFFAVISTFQSQLEWWVRFTGGLIGLAIAAITLYNLVTGKNKKP